MRKYEHGGNVYAHPGCVDFSANLNPLGMPQGVRDALREHVDAFAAYPDSSCTELVRSIAAFEHVPASWVVPCAGATDAFARLCAALRPRQALVCAPCYSGYEQALEQVGASIAYHDLGESRGFALDDAFLCDLDQGVDVAFVANPNNPTGRCVDRGLLSACLARADESGATMVLDECFIDFTNHKGSNDLLDRHPGLVVIKACTKTFCLAGLRLGYALCADERLARRLREVGQPWAVSVPAQLAGVAALADADYLERSRAYVARERRRLAGALARSGMRVVEGEANYVLFRATRNLADEFLAHGILVRSCDNFRGLDACWHRVAVRTSAENTRLIEALSTITKAEGTCGFLDGIA